MFERILNTDGACKTDYDQSVDDEGTDQHTSVNRKTAYPSTSETVDPPEHETSLIHKQSIVATAQAPKTQPEDKAESTRLSSHNQPRTRIIFADC